MPRFARAAICGSTVVVFAAMAVPAAAPRVALDDDVIAYQGKGRLYLINADGSGQRVIVPGGVADRTFAWSPDGLMIALTAGTQPMRTSRDQSSIRIVSAEGSGARLLTRQPGRTAREPSWSPDGTRLVFTGHSVQDDAWELYIIGSNGKGLRKLTRGGGRYGHDSPDWSPTGEWIVFESWNGGVLHTMKVIRPDGTGLRRIGAFPASGHCLCPDWSPDGAKIAYQADVGASAPDKPEVFVMNSDGTGSSQLTRNNVLDENPDWSQDGTRIAFYSGRRGNAEIYVMNADGRRVTRVTHDPWYSQLPRWRPAP